MDKASRPVRWLIQLHADERASAAVSFILAFPIFLFLIAILVQYALLANAKASVDHAVTTASRAAVTSLPDGRPENVMKAAYMSLAPLSPRAQVAASADGTTMYDALTRTGLTVPADFPERYTYAQSATEVHWPDHDYEYSDGRSIEVGVIYRFRLTVPLAGSIIGNADTIAGISGRFATISESRIVQTAHSRRARASGEGLEGGWPP